jgi:aminodeoxyfutalosine deaminase
LVFHYGIPQKSLDSTNLKMNPMFRKISAQYVYTGSGKVLKRGIVVVNSNGTVVEVIDTQGNLTEMAGLEFYDGILVPGFVNVHSHLELAHLHQKIAPHKGLIRFIIDVGRFRAVPVTQTAIRQADRTMYQNGIVAVGDISNTTDSFEVKAQSHIRYITFAEVFGAQESVAEEKIRAGQQLVEKLRALRLPGFLAPHAPYSVSPKMWQLLVADARNLQSIWSIHNQEAEEENLLFEKKEGAFCDFLRLFTTEFMDWETNGKTSPEHCLPYYTESRRTLLVHNTFTTAHDIEVLKPHKEKFVWVLCPNANLYIENRLPDVAMLAGSGIPIAIGTDSLASNHGLSILEEMKTLQGSFPSISLNELVQWATLNGARALGLETELGSFEVGKNPGINLVSAIDFHEMKLTSESSVKRIL